MKSDLLGTYQLSKTTFQNLEEVFQQFRVEKFLHLNEHKKQNLVNKALFELIRKESDHPFLLSEVVDFISQIHTEKILKYYALSNFELWLNQFSNITNAENLEVRSKIMGKYVPREEFQIFFPIGMDKYHNGSHFVTAHSSPDLDTTIASFWGWVDAFTARVGEGLHLWNVPGGPPEGEIEIDLLFKEILGEGVFDCLVKTRSSLTLSSFDLLTQKGMIKKHPHDLALSLDHERNINAIVITDEDGYYLGDWRHFDVEGVRQVIMALNNSLRWLENEVHISLISLFTKSELNITDLPHFFQSIFSKRLGDYEPIQEFTLRQQKYLSDFLHKILTVPGGLDSTFEEFTSAIESLDITDFSPFKWSLSSLTKSNLFDDKGKVIENRPKIFSFLEKVLMQLSESFKNIRAYIEQLDIALRIKTEVFGYLPQYLSYRADIEEIKTKMDGYPYLTVNYPESEGKLIPVGIIHLSDLQKPYLGTVSLRDFCNREETVIPPYLEVISVIDHHKSSLSTSSPPVALITDSQSTNTLVAEMTFTINDRYTCAGMTHTEIQKQRKEIEKDLFTPSQVRILKNLLSKQVAAKSENPYYISPKREYLEYLQFLYAILDDTDLLTKVSMRDVQCVAALLNRMKTLMLRKETEIVHFDDIPKDKNFVEQAAKRLLQNEDLYSLYSKIYSSKEFAIDENIESCIAQRPSPIFSDTKVQNNLARIGQLKIFVNNLPTLEKNVDALQNIWLQNAITFHGNKPEIDLHLQMVSTIASAEDLFSGNELSYSHYDQLWIWIPMTDLSIEHLRLFLNSFKNAPHVIHNEIEIELLGDNATELKQVFKDSFRRVPINISEKGMPIAIMRYKAASMNSRKAMFSPYLPVNPR